MPLSKQFTKSVASPTIPTGQLTIITLVLKLQKISIHSWMVAQNPSSVHFYFWGKKYHEIEEAEKGDLGYHFLMSAKDNFYWAFHKINISSHGPARHVQWCYVPLCTTYQNQNIHRQMCHTDHKDLRVCWTLLNTKQAQVLGLDFICFSPEPPGWEALTLVKAPLCHPNRVVE